MDGWDGVTEMDIAPGGTGEAVPFSPELWAEWISDHPEAWGPVTDAVVAQYKAHDASRAEARKNS